MMLQLIFVEIKIQFFSNAIKIEKKTKSIFTLSRANCSDEKAVRGRFSSLSFLTFGVFGLRYLGPELGRSLYRVQ